MSLKDFFKEHFTYEKRTEYLALYSILINALIAIAKFVLAYVFKESGGGFFAISGLVNIFMLIARMLCYKGMKHNKDLSLYTFAIFIFVVISGIVYILYMSRMFYYQTMHIDYPIEVGIALALVAFIEIILSIRGLFTVKGKGHFYRDIKLINLSGALVAIVLAQVSLLAFSAETKKANIWDGVLGLVVGSAIILIAVFILVSPKISIVDRGKKTYHITENSKYIPQEIVLLKGIIYGKCSYKYIRSDDLIEGAIVREKSPFNSLRWYFKMTIIIFSIVLVIPYLIGAIINYFIVGYTPIMLDEFMEENGYKK